MVYDNTDFEFSIRSIRRLFKNSTNKRVSEDSLKELGQEMNDFGLKVTKKAMEVAEEDGRETVRGEDIRQAVREH